MARRKHRLFVLGFVGFFVFMLVASTNVAQAQPLGDDYIEDDKLHILVRFDGIPITEAIDDAHAIEVDLESTMDLYLQVNVTNDVPLNISGAIWFYYNDIPIIPIAIQQPGTNSSWVPLPHNQSIIPVSVPLNFSQILDVAGLDLLTGRFKASLDFTYFEFRVVLRNSRRQGGSTGASQEQIEELD